MNRPILTPERLDAMLEGKTKPAGRIIWTAEAIGKRLGCSADFVRDKLATEEGSPIKKIGGRFCVHEGDLMAWFRG